MIPTRVRRPFPDLDRLRPGGSAWWYVDLVDPRGDGVVFIVALGLPFLPGYASAARAGTPLDPRRWPAVALSTVRAGVPDFYVLQPLSAVQTDGRSWSWPGSSLTFDADDGRLRLKAQVRGELPGCPWSADVDVVGALRRPTADEPDADDHEWTVVCAGGQGTATVRAGGVEHTVTGNAYVDRNLSTGPWSGGGWSWGRAAGPAGVHVWYADDERATGSFVGVDGETRAADVRVEGGRRGRWGVPRPSVVEVGSVRLALDAPIDDGPFYTRLLLREGATAVGFAESCRIGRIDRAWSRPLVRMTVGGLWHPLFCGPRKGRLGRLVRHAVGR